MDFVYLDGLLGPLVVNLDILKRNSQRKNILLYQHEGSLAADNTRIGNTTDMSDRLRAFMRLAKENGVDLAITPEYSCPLSNVEEIIQNQASWPNDGKLWVIGGESITKDEIERFRQTCNAGNISIHFEEALLQSPNNYFNPLFYIFTSFEAEIKTLIICIQFKTMHMGVWGGGDIERNNLILGNIIYVLRNSQTSIQLLSLICSEAMNFERNLTLQQKERLYWDDLPYLILNPQVNPDPAHHNFASFRRFILSFSNKEIVTLNWNRNSTLAGNIFLRYNSSRSGLFVKSDEVELKNTSRIRKNHKLGVYYFLIGPNKHAFILNSTPHAYLLSTPPVSITEGLPEQIKRDGPEITQIYSFDQTNNLLPLPGISDNHIEYLESVGCSNDSV